MRDYRKEQYVQALTFRKILGQNEKCIGHSFRDDGSILLVKYEGAMLLLCWSWLDLKILQFYDPMDQLR